jgi:hypothetical protein
VAGIIAGEGGGCILRDASVLDKVQELLNAEGAEDFRGVRREDQTE